MLESLNLIKYILAQGAGWIVLLATGLGILVLWLRRILSRRMWLVVSAAGLLGIILVGSVAGLPRPGYPLWLTTFGPADGPVLPFKNVLAFFRHLDTIERIPNIARDPRDVGTVPSQSAPSTVKIDLEATEVLAEMAPGIVLNYWTFNNTVPGPFLRIRQGDTVELTLRNHPTSIQHHSIDLHAVNGPGGGAVATSVAPGESKSFTFKALNPGLYVYHCAHPNAATHMAHGMYGLILVEPDGGLPPVDQEYYVMQGEAYATGQLGKKGLQIFDAKRMLNGQPSYVVFNGKTGALVDTMTAQVGDRVRFYVGNGGVNLISSFHVIGEIFDVVYPEGAIGSEPHRNIQSTVIPAGGATIVEFTTDVPGKYVLVDHALARADRGAWGVLEVFGPNNEDVFQAETETTVHNH